MNPQENPDYERRLWELEKELDKEQPLPSIETRSGQPLVRHADNSQAKKSSLNQVATWFNSLPSAGRLAVVIIAALISFSILKSVLQLVGALFSLAILGVILYLVYKFLITPQSPK